MIVSGTGQGMIKVATGHYDIVTGVLHIVSGKYQHIGVKITK